MARPKSDDRRNAILAAAIRIIFQQGLSAPTAVIAQEAGISNGSLFTYFETKTALYNQLYIELKEGMALAALEGLPAGASLRKQFFHVWTKWMLWAVHNPEKRRALALLSVADEITPSSRTAGHQVMTRIASLMERSRANGPMRDVPFTFVVTIMTSLAEATMDYMVRDPANASEHCKVGFDALWRMLK